MAQYGHSEACCNTPVAKPGDYKGKGRYIDINGMKTYATGPSSATSAILIIFDIFGFFPQTIQGADILAHEDDEHHQYQVFMPDFFYGKPASTSDFPPDTDEKKKRMGAFFEGPASVPDTAAKIPGVLKEIEKQCPGIKQWGVLGMCWGGKIVSLTSQSGTPFSAAAEVHPAFIDKDDGKKVTIPICILASKDENAEDVQAFKEALSVKSHVDTFSDQIHGWMSARADLENSRCKSEYERGYKTLLDFYHTHL